MDNIDKLSNEQLIQIIKKYQICELKPMSREEDLTKEVLDHLKDLSKNLIIAEFLFSFSR